MSKGTIIYIGGFELPDKNAAAHRVKANGKLIESTGYKVVYVGVKKGKDLKTPELKKNDEYELKYPKNKLQWLNYLMNINDIKEIINNYNDVKAVILYNYQALAYSKLIKWCKGKDIKVIADCTEWYGIGKGNLIFKIIKKLDTEYRMRYLHKKSDGLIVISEFLFNYYREKSNIIVLPPLVDLKDDKWNIKRLNTDKLTFTYAGSPGVEKDSIAKIIEYFLMLDEIVDYELNIVGITHQQYLEFHDESFVNNNKNIKFIGRLTHQESLQYIKNSDFTIFLRENNIVTKAGFPTKFVESISAQVPVITNNNSDVKKYLVNKSEGFLLEDTDFVSFKKIFNYDLDYMKSMKENVDSSKFYYKKYQIEFNEFLKNVLT